MGYKLQRERVPMTAMDLLNLAQGWVEGSSEFDWDEVPPTVQQEILSAALSFQLWVKGFERVIHEPPEIEE